MEISRTGMIFKVRESRELFERSRLAQSDRLKEDGETA